MIKVIKNRENYYTFYSSNKTKLIFYKKYWVWSPEAALIWSQGAIALLVVSIILKNTFTFSSF